MTRLALEPRNRWLDARTLLTPQGRLLRLGREAPAALRALQAGTTDGRVLAFGRRLLDAGAAHPRPTRREGADVTVVVPVKDRVAELDRCLAALAHDDVLVVDDGSKDRAAVAAVCTARGARIVRRDNGGPAAARNTALPLLDRDFVAFVDSDCEVPSGWLQRLRGHFDDPRVVAVAPRILGGPRSPLDLGPQEAAVRPGTAVGYVPTAALIVRRSALTAFDETLRYGEDVDLVWRLVDAGGIVRYDPSVVVRHAEPRRLADRLARRYHYGTSAAALSRRHPEHLTHLVLSPLPSITLALLFGRKPLLALGSAAFATYRLDRQLHQPAVSALLVAEATAATGMGAGRALALAGPLAWGVARRDRRVGVLLLAPVLKEWWDRGRPEGPVRFAARALLDQAAYGAGVVAGCARERTVRPLVPRVATRRGRGARQAALSGEVDDRGAP